MNILISGGAGYIGSQISHDLIDKGYNITIIDNLSTGNKFFFSSKADFYRGDINNIPVALLFEIYSGLLAGEKHAA